MREIDIYIRVIHTAPAKRGSAIVLYRYGGKVKDLYFSTLEITHNRSILLASINAIVGLKGGCTVNLYTQNNFGFAFMGNQKKWVNRDLGNVLHSCIERGGHIVNFIDCSASDEGQVYQQALAKRIQKETP